MRRNRLSNLIVQSLEIIYRIYECETTSMIIYAIVFLPAIPHKVTIKSSHIKHYMDSNNSVPLVKPTGLVSWFFISYVYLK